MPGKEKPVIQFPGARTSEQQKNCSEGELLYRFVEAIEEIADSAYAVGMYYKEKGIREGILKEEDFE